MTGRGDMNIRYALRASTSVLAFASRAPVIGEAPDGRPLRAISPANAEGPIIGHLYAIPAGGVVEDDPVMKRSPDSAAMLEYWDKTDALVDGAEAVRLKGSLFLPRFKGEEGDSYDNRVMLTKYTNVYQDIIEGLASKPFEKEVSLINDGENQAPQEILDFIENVDGAGNNLTVFASLMFFNAINSAIHWVFVDYPTENPNVRSIADAKAAGRRPYWSHILGRNVLWATSQMIDGNEVLTYIKIYEPGSPDHVREFIRDNNGVTWRLLQKGVTTNAAGKPEWKEVDKGRISIGVIPIVPFATGRRDGRTYRYNPPMRSAADLQIELYQQESALKFLKTMGAYSMLTGNGVKPPVDADGKPQKLAVGPLQVLYAPPDGSGASGEWKFIQPDPAVMTFLANDCKDTIANLRELGRQPLTAQSGNLTVITAATAAGKARSAVSGWALLEQDALENCMDLTLRWLAITATVPVNVYSEFDDFTEGKDLETIDNDRNRGDISRQTLWEEKKRRGVYSSEFTPEREEERMLAEVPSDGPDNGQDDEPPTED